MSSINCDDGVVNVYDSMYNELDLDTVKVVFNLFGTVRLNFVKLQKQNGGRENGGCHHLQPSVDHKSVWHTSPEIAHVKIF